MVKLFQLKAIHGWSDGSFKELLALLKDMLPQGNTVPETVYEAKQIICPLGLEVEKIHACKNDCILYRGSNYQDLEKCPVCGLDRFNRRKDGGDDEDCNRTKGGPKKVFWYFPIVPRLVRWFANKKESELLRWHKEKHKVDGLIRHPADATQWRNIDLRYPKFAEDPRNIRIAMSTDGMNPFMNNSTHSTWPIVLTIYNLPPWLCNKRKYIMLSGLIPGPHQPGNDIDTYFSPLVDDLKLLWCEGVEVWDEYKREYFQLRAILFATIRDSPAARNLSGQSKKVGCGCPHCLRETDSEYLSESKKIVYMGHRRYLGMKHPFRNMCDHFNGKAEKRRPPPHFSGHDVYEMVKNVHVVLGKRKGEKKGKRGKKVVVEEDDMWKKQSIFWELPYWKDLDIRHSIDVMHVEKNVCESLLGTLLNMDGKTKDHAHARADLKKMKIREELWLNDDSVKGMELPTSCITLSKNEKKEFCEFLKSVKVPTGYSTNVSKLVSMPDLKLSPGIKSHDYHVLLTQMIAVGIRNILPVNVREAIMNLCFFFNAIGQKVLSEEDLESLEKKHYETLCVLEMYFPPAFFDISLHFTGHLIKEIKLLGPVFLHQMYAYERFNGILKSLVRNRAFPEGSMVQGYCTEEAIEWALNYADPSNPVGVPKSRHEGRLTGTGTIGKKAIIPDRDLFHRAHFHVLQQMDIVSEYFDEHKELLLRENPLHSESWLAKEHMNKFCGWLRNRISRSDTPISEQLKILALGPIFTVMTYQGYDINGYTFYTERQDKKSMYQNSGVRVDAYDVNGEDKTAYYGQIQEIWELDFHGFKIALFRCNWVDANRGVQKDKYGFVSVDLSRHGYKTDPFVLAQHVAQVFYVSDTTNKRLKVVIPGKRRIVGVENAVDEEEFDQFDEIPPFATSMIKPRIPSANETPYLRNDHKEKVKNFKKPREQRKVAK
jgi:hypothetical protein